MFNRILNLTLVDPYHPEPVTLSRYESDEHRTSLRGEDWTRVQAENPKPNRKKRHPPQLLSQVGTRTPFLFPHCLPDDPGLGLKKSSHCKTIPCSVVGSAGTIIIHMCMLYDIAWHDFSFCVVVIVTFSLRFLSSVFFPFCAIFKNETFYSTFSRFFL